jgi:uncharacterized protein YfdQ (DUF2303 family)
MEYPDNAKTILEAGREAGQIRQASGLQPYAIVPDGTTMEPIPQAPDKVLYRVEAAPRFNAWQDFAAYINRFKVSSSQVFGHRVTGDKSSIVKAVIDYHKQPVTPGGDIQSVPMHGTHLPTLVLQHSEEWVDWTRQNREEMTQLEFAAFLEDHFTQVTKPDGASLLELVLAFQASETAEFKSIKNLGNGQVAFAYTTSIEEKGLSGDPITMPKVIELQLAPYIGLSPVLMTARFKYRLKGGQLTLWYELEKVDQTLRGAFEAICKGITDAVGLPVYSMA